MRMNRLAGPGHGVADSPDTEPVCIELEGKWHDVGLAVGTDGREAAEWL